MVNDSFSTAFQILEWDRNPRKFWNDVFKEEPYPYSLKVMENIYNSKRHLILSAASTGKTKLLASLGLKYAVLKARITRTPITVILLGGSLLQAKISYGFILEALTNPVLSSLVKGEPRQTDTTFTDSSKIKALPNSMTATQGQHGALMIVDEASLVSDFQLRDCNRVIGPFDGTLIWSGTPTVYESLFVRTFEEEKKKPEPEREWKIWTWSTKDCPSPHIQALREKMKESLPEDMWKIFWEGEPYAITGTLIPRDALVESCRGITRFEYDPKLSTIFGVDWGFGTSAFVIAQKAEDVYKVLEVYSWNQVDFESIHQFIETKARSYNPQRIFCDLSFKGENQRLRARGLPVFEVDFAKERSMLDSRLRDLFVKRKIFIPDDNYTELQQLLMELRLATWIKKEGQDRRDALVLAVKEFESDSNVYNILTSKPKRRALYGSTFP